MKPYDEIVRSKLSEEQIQDNRDWAAREMEQGLVRLQKENQELRDRLIAISYMLEGFDLEGFFKDTLRELKEFLSL